MRPTVAILLVTIAVWGAGLAVGNAARSIRDGWPKTEEYVVLPPPGAALYVSVPPTYRELAADIVWARALVYYGSSITGETDLRYLERFIDTVLELDPKFRRVYRW